MVKIYIIAIAVLILAEIIGKMAGLETSMVVSATAEIAHLSPYTGLISDLDILGWDGSVVICLFMAFVSQLNKSLY